MTPFLESTASIERKANMADRQTQFDYPRQSQLAMLRDCRLPKCKSVAASLLKLLLKMIDDYGRGEDAWPTQETLANACGVEARTIRRALTALENLSLVIIERKKNRYGTTTNHYRIVWSELDLLRTQGPNPVPKDSLQGTPPTASHKPTNRTFEGDQADIPGVPTGHLLHTNRTCMSYKPTEAQITSSTLSGEGEVEEDFETWEEAEQQLEVRGLATAPQIAHEARCRGLNASEVLQAIRDYDANRSHFRGPGAITFRLRTGAWPTNVIIKPAVDRELERAMKASIESYVVEWRAARVTEQDIARRLYAGLQNQELTSRGLSRELLVRMGWVDPATTPTPASGASV